MSLRLGLTLWEAGYLASGSRVSSCRPTSSDSPIRIGFGSLLAGRHPHYHGRSTFSTTSSTTARSAPSSTGMTVPRNVPAPPMPKPKSQRSIPPTALSPPRTSISHTAAPRQTEKRVSFWKVLFRKPPKAQSSPAPVAARPWREPDNWPWIPLLATDAKADQKLVYARPFQSGKNTNPLRMLLEVFLTGVAWSTALVWTPRYMVLGIASLDLDCQRLRRH